VHPAVALRYPFLTLEQAAFFLQVPVAAASRLYDQGELPKALRMDGGVFQPTRGVRLVPYLEFHAQLAEDTQAVLELWQRGRLSVPKPDSQEAAPLGFKSVLRSLIAGVTANDRTGEV
jgi:hypothetical protein